MTDNPDGQATQEQREQERAAAFLRLAEARPGSNRFVIGGFGGGITLYKQQVRALNLLYSIEEAGRLRGETRPIAVIGGGAAGVTAAAAAIALGHDVYLFEQRPLLLHLQHGCDTRWVHPHLFDWPEHGSERPHAGLPLLNWRMHTAAEVSVQIEKLFDRLRASPDCAARLTTHLGVELKVDRGRRVTWEGSDNDRQRSGDEEFAAVIFALGFGVENYVAKKLANSYWRNDSLNQAEPGRSAGRKTRFLISGTGDGGLIDLLRACVKGFNQGRIIRELIPRDAERLRGELRKIKRQWEQGGPKPAGWLFDQFSNLDKADLLDGVKENLKARQRTDTEVILNGRFDNLRAALTLNGAMLFNSLLTYLLWSTGRFHYRRGECRPLKTGVNIGGKFYPGRDYTIILRHGTKREAVFRSVRCLSEMRALTREAEKAGALDTSARLWTAGWWEQRVKYLGGQRREFVPPATLAIATTFVSTLSDVIKQMHRGDPALRFRIALHRLIEVQGEEFFQQISRYAGTHTAGDPGRVFTVRAGLGGLASRLGRPVIVRRHEDFGRLWDELAFGGLGARRIDPAVNALLACPFFAPPGRAAAPQHVSLVLFMDAGRLDFFDAKKNAVLKSVYAACRGFVENLETMYRNGEADFGSSDYVGYKFSASPKELKVVKKYGRPRRGGKSIEIENRVFASFVSDLTFRRVTSFDADFESVALQDGEEGGRG